MAWTIRSLGCDTSSKELGLSVEAALSLVTKEERRAQTWRLCGAMFVAFGVFAALARV